MYNTGPPPAFTIQPPPPSPTALDTGGYCAGGLPRPNHRALQRINHRQQKIKNKTLPQTVVFVLAAKWGPGLGLQFSSRDRLFGGLIARGASVGPGSVGAGGVRGGAGS